VKLILYSGGHEDENIALDLEAIRLSGKKKPSMTYIPSWSFDGELEFHDYVNHHRQYGIKKFIYFPIDHPFDQSLMRAAFSSDIIHLSGGNTFYFLKYLKKSGTLKRLKQFVREGGVLTGLSAGGIIMTPDIKTASYPAFDRDDNDENIKSLKAMNLVKFEFFPHYRNSKRYDKEILRESKKTKYPVWALPDGSGVVIEGQSVHIIGKAWRFYQGEKTRITH
jgi:dipeptidase E